MWDLISTLKLTSKNPMSYVNTKDSDPSPKRPTSRSSQPWSCEPCRPYSLDPTNLTCTDRCLISAPSSSSRPFSRLGHRAASQNSRHSRDQDSLRHKAARSRHRTCREKKPSKTQTDPQTTPNLSQKGALQKRWLDLQNVEVEQFFSSIPPQSLCELNHTEILQSPTLITRARIQEEPSQKHAETPSNMLVGTL